MDISNHVYKTTSQSSYSINYVANQYPISVMNIEFENESYKADFIQVIDNHSFPQANGDH